MEILLCMCQAKYAIDVDRLNQLELWTNVSQIVYQMALGAAAVGNL